MFTPCDAKFLEVSPRLNRACLIVSASVIGSNPCFCLSALIKFLSASSSPATPAAPEWRGRGRAGR